MREAIRSSVRFKVFERDRFTCRYCGRSAPAVILEVDHVHPVSAGGTNSEANLVTSCFDCNRGKRARPVSESYIQVTAYEPRPDFSTPLPIRRRVYREDVDDAVEYWTNDCFYDFVKGLESKIRACLALVPLNEVKKAMDDVCAEMCPQSFSLGPAQITLAKRAARRLVELVEQRNAEGSGIAPPTL